jgi:hypothetical protein
VLPGDTHCIAIALIRLEIAPLAMVDRAISGVATRKQIGGGKAYLKGGESGQKQR